MLGSGLPGGLLARARRPRASADTGAPHRLRRIEPRARGRLWEAGHAAGHPDARAPGLSNPVRPTSYGAFLLDPDGNSAEAVHHEGVRRDGNVDHVWIRQT